MLVRREMLGGGLATIAAGCGLDPLPAAGDGTTAGDESAGASESGSDGAPTGPQRADPLVPVCDADPIVESIWSEGEDAFVPLRTWIESGTDVGLLYAAAHTVESRAGAPDNDIHQMAQVGAAYRMAGRVRDQHPLLPLCRVWAELHERQPNDSDLSWEDLPAPDEAEEALADAIEVYDGERAEGALLALYERGPAALVGPLTYHCLRDHTWLGHDTIWTAFALRCFDDFGWGCAPWVLRGLARAFGVDDINGPNTAAFEMNVQRVGELPDDWRDGVDDPSAVSALLATYREADAVACVDATIAALHAGLGLRTLWTALEVAAIEFVIRWQNASPAVHELDTLHALRQIQSRTPDENTARLALLQAAAWRQDFRAFDTRDPLLEDIESFVPAATTPASLDAVFESLAGDRVEAARNLAAYFAAGGAPEQVIAAWPDVIVGHAGPDQHHYKYHLAVLEEAEAALPEWRPTLLLGITSRGPSSLDTPAYRYDEAVALIDAVGA